MYFSFFNKAYILKKEQKKKKKTPHYAKTRQGRGEQGGIAHLLKQF